MASRLRRDVIDTILHSLEPDYVAGLTLLGGEPFEPANQPQWRNCCGSCRRAAPAKCYGAFTGFLLDRDLLSGRVGDAARNAADARLHRPVRMGRPVCAGEKDAALRFAARRISA